MTATMTKKTVVPFSRADYAKRRQKHSDEERSMKAFLEGIFHRKFSWRRIRWYVWYSNQGRPETPIVID